MSAQIKCSAVVLTFLLTSASVWAQTLTPVGPGQPIPPPPKLFVDPNQLNQISSSAGSAYAQDMIEKIGELYNVKVNFVRGMNRAVQMIGDHDSLSEIRNRSPQYSSSYSAGIPEGEGAGVAAGDSAAKNSAQKLADADITQLIDAALDSGLGTNIKFIMNPRVLPFSGLQSPLSVPSRLFSSRFVSEMQLAGKSPVDPAH